MHDVLLYELALGLAEIQTHHLVLKHVPRFLPLLLVVLQLVVPALNKRLRVLRALLGPFCYLVGSCRLLLLRLRRGRWRCLRLLKGLFVFPGNQAPIGALRRRRRVGLSSGANSSLVLVPALPTRSHSEAYLLLRLLHLSFFWFAQSISH